MIIIVQIWRLIIYANHNASQNNLISTDWHHRTTDARDYNSVDVLPAYSLQ